MDSSAFLGLEVPALGVAAGQDSHRLAGWRSLLEAAARAGMGAVWVNGAPAGGPGVSCDPCTLAAAAVGIPAPRMLGVVARPPGDRHPAVLARDVSAIDVVSGGRAAVLVRWSGPSSGRLADDVEYVAEVAAICRSVWTDPDPVFEGRFLHVAGAVNRPPPVQPGGPPLLVELPAAWIDAVAAGGVPEGVVVRLLRAASGVVTPGTPAQLRSCRQWLDHLDRDRGGRPGAARTPLLWRAVVGADGDEVATQGDDSRHAGADGVVATLVGLPVDALDGLTAVEAVLGQLIGPWRR